MKTLLLTLALVLVSSAAHARYCYDIRPMRPAGCRNGYVVCACVDQYDPDTCRWVWVCE